MTLQNLRYIVEISKYHSFSQAAKSLYMSQSTLSASVKELEEELGIQIFVRNNRGVTLTPEGEDCLKYSKDILERSNLLALRYQEQKSLKTYFSISTQHLPYAVRAFQELSDSFPEEYDIAIRETTTSGVLYDVSAKKSELGILAIPLEHFSLIQKAIYSYNLVFTELAKLKTYAFIRKQHPLAKKSIVSLNDLNSYPFVTYDQEDAPGYYTEEALFFKPLKQSIHVCDRATKMLIIRNTDAFSIGVDLPNFNYDLYFSNKDTELIAIPLSDFPNPMIAGYIHNNDHSLSENSLRYIDLLNKHIEQLSLPGVH
ncbi:hypothetical protein P261_02177 [Lachnospiraceae bacterium TWA4]|nr:hypothetical protein P261_02177 [Lachnospiraceae bacterium TWA4]